MRAARWPVIAGLATVLAACAVAPPRSDDPLQKFNRRVFAFNQVADKTAIRPVAKAYVKLTGPKERVLIGNFFENLRSPVTIINDLLQGRPAPALEAGGRFLVNSTVGFLGFFNPAGDMNLPAHPTDFGVTLAHWGVPEGPYLVLPFIGPTTLRDVWRFPVDTYFDPLGWYARGHAFEWHAQYLPSAAYLVTLRASALPLDPMIDSAYDPYAFVRDAYRQHRLFEIYYGNPPLPVIERLQGTEPDQKSDQEIDQLLLQQHAYEKSHRVNHSSVPRPASSSHTPEPPVSSSAPSPPTAAARPVASGGDLCCGAHPAVTLHGKDE